MGDCQHYNQGYCYYYSDNRTKDFCENICENNCGEELDEEIEFDEVIFNNEDKEMDCLGCTLTKENACADCCRDWDNEG